VFTVASDLLRDSITRCPSQAKGKDLGGVRWLICHHEMLFAVYVGSGSVGRGEVELGAGDAGSGSTKTEMKRLGKADSIDVEMVG
jgi:hypothetical protein